MKLATILLTVLFSSLFACDQKSDSHPTTVLDLAFKLGQYNHLTFPSKQRAAVDFNVYLPPNWSSTKVYPLVILLHGQGEDEYTFLSALPADSLNQWIQQKKLPEMVLIALRGGSNTNEMQWYTDKNEAMITSTETGELRSYCQQHFSTSISSDQIALMGHSRGATGALNFAFYFPTKFSAVVASAFVSDYALDRLQQACHSNQKQILESGLQIQLLIGSKDQYVLNHNRKGSPSISAYLKSKGIAHDFNLIAGKTHRLSELWAYPTNLNYLQSCASSWEE